MGTGMTFDELLQLLGLIYDPRIYQAKRDTHREFVDQMVAYEKSRPIHSYEHDGIHYDIFN